jgi:hypothetical protein
MPSSKHWPAPATNRMSASARRDKIDQMQRSLATYRIGFL